MVTIKSQRELELMRQSGKLVAQILMKLADLVEPGISLIELDRIAEEMTIGYGAVPAFKGYSGYKHTLCTSVNEQIVHGIPSDRKLKEGDIVGVDFGLVLNGFYGDSAVTVPVGKVSASAIRLMTATRDSLYAGIDAARSGNTVKHIARAVEQTVVPLGFSVVREFVGHGIGTRLHEDPQIPNYEAGAGNFKLKPGMTICIEPMVNAGKAGTKVLSDRWTAVTVDGRLSAHFEHSIAITEEGAEVLTEWDEPAFKKVFSRIAPMEEGNN